MFITSVLKLNLTSNLFVQYKITLICGHFDVSIIICIIYTRKMAL